MRARIDPRPALVLSACIAALLTAPLAAQTLTTEQRGAVLAEAQQAYDGGVAAQRTDPEEARRRFELAAERFELLVEDGVDNGRLWYNLANARLQAGQLGEAILAYRRAERLIPGDPRLRSNLGYARSLVRSQIEASGGSALLAALLTWHRRTPTELRLGLFVVAYLAIWPALLMLVLVQRSPGAWRAVTIGMAAVALVTGVSVADDLWGGAGGSAGVLLTDEVVVRKGNGEGYEARFEEPLHQGVEFELIERRGGWLHVELRDGSTGWVRADQAALVDAATA